MDLHAEEFNPVKSAPPKGGRSALHEVGLSRTSLLDIYSQVVRYFLWLCIFGGLSVEMIAYFM